MGLRAGLQALAGMAAGSATSAVKGRTIWDDRVDKQRSRTGHFGCELMWFRVQLVYILAEQHKPTQWEKVLFACEQPRDPAEYREDGTEYFSVWQTEEWKTFQARFKHQMTTFDQGALGHVKRKPTTIGHNVPHLHELHGMSGHGSETTDKWSAEPDLGKRLEQTGKCSACSPGLKAALVAALQRWLRSLIKEYLEIVENFVMEEIFYKRVHS